VKQLYSYLTWKKAFYITIFGEKIHASLNRGYAFFGEDDYNWEISVFAKEKIYIFQVGQL
jgi:hypothetical protein